MTLRALLFLSILLSGVGGHSPSLVSNLLKVLEHEVTGFRAVFPKNYNTTHYYNETLLCSGEEEECCLLRAVSVLSQDWYSLLSNLWPGNMKTNIIKELHWQLSRLTEERVNTPVDVSRLRPLSSPPEQLLSLTSSLLKHWLTIHSTLTHSCEGREGEGTEWEGEGEVGPERGTEEEGARESERKRRKGFPVTESPAGQAAVLQVTQMAVICLATAVHWMGL
ncbi:hypothetical protein AOXY_G33748 [Acipenser oxyrinchus oxyrinchus]|uniref:Uncharacterized protein n=1 Tax=Acipenser oxyrinchus oxyrinchus TaxID=40147 RepID=A0AAD8CJ83_ACIOX|nr:hypothetical protein AOXY_G33748 [Acipenser oxyrinchus oxyrinchus]